MTTLANFTAAPLTGPDQEQDLAKHVGSVVLVVNTASKCGHTPQYAALQDLYQRFRDKGLVILGFPCDQFKHQEPGSAEEIAEFCSVNYGVTFPMFAKIDVNGEHSHPLYQWLTGEHPSAGVPAGDIEWNFAKFLLGRDGQVIARYAPDTPPADLTDDIQRAL